MFEYNDDYVNLVEVGPRDGLQNEKTVLELEQKLKYIELLKEAGLKVIEATSFVRADRIPQMGDASALFTELTKKSFFKQTRFPCLVPNLKGFEMAKACGVKEISLFSATSDDFTKKNINCSVDESFERMKPVAQAALEDGMKIRGYISTAFGCPYAGEMSSKELSQVAEKFLKLGVSELSIGDTIGVATPKQVYNYTTDLLSVAETSQVAMHFHDTRGMALANILASLEKGIRIFDASSGGLGGCPYAKGATGNIATEDVIYLLHSIGMNTGVDLEKLYTASDYILNAVGRDSPSKFIQTYFKRK